MIEYRRYAAAYYTNQVDPKGWAQSEMRTLAQEIEMALAAEELDGR